MSELARRTAARIIFAGTDISGDIAPYLESVTYTDNEEDETDDLQIVLSDAGGTIVDKWMKTPANLAASSGGNYIVSATTGAYFRTGKSNKYANKLTLPYGTRLELLDNDGEWAHIRYSGQDGYVAADCVRRAETDTAGWAVGDDVTVSGRPQYTSYGEGHPGALVTNYEGKITYLNLKEDVPYPICVGYLGWFAESQVTKRGYSGGGHSGGVASRQVGGGSFLGGVTKGLLISAAILSSAGVLNCGQFELDSVTASGPPDRVTIKGTALPYTSSIRQTDKCKVWENFDLKGIAEEIASRNGMACMFSGNSNPSYKRVEQYKQSDIQFLKKLCNDAGCSLKVSNNIIVVFEQAYFERRAPVHHISRGGSNYIKYSLKTGKNDTYSSCEVSWTKPDGECIVGTAEADGKGKEGQTLRITQKVGSVGEAEQVAAYQLRLHNKMELTASFTMVGNPALTAGCAVTISGFGDWSGKYIIKKARHSVGNGGYTTTIELRKV